jgi:hypothetical protein
MPSFCILPLKMFSQPYWQGHFDLLSERAAAPIISLRRITII